jgi:hypothetical protein
LVVSQIRVDMRFGIGMYIQYILSVRWQRTQISGPYIRIRMDWGIPFNLF